MISEREFFATMPASIVKKDATGEIILQGVVDLILIRENEIFVLDYKTGKIDDEKFKRYSFQISAYADAIERAYEKKVTKKILCLIDEKKLIEI